MEREFATTTPKVGFIMFVRSSHSLPTLANLCGYRHIMRTLRALRQFACQTAYDTVLLRSNFHCRFYTRKAANLNDATAVILLAYPRCLLLVHNDWTNIHETWGNLPSQDIAPLTSGLAVQSAGGNVSMVLCFCVNFTPSWRSFWCVNKESQYRLSVWPFYEPPVVGESSPQNAGLQNCKRFFILFDLSPSEKKEHRVSSE